MYTSQYSQQYDGRYAQQSPPRRYSYQPAAAATQATAAETQKPNEEPPKTPATEQINSGK